MGIMLGGLGAMAPHRKADMAAIVFRAMIAGNVACFMTACIAGMYLSIHLLYTCMLQVYIQCRNRVGVPKPKRILTHRILSQSTVPKLDFFAVKSVSINSPGISL